MLNSAERVKKWRRDTKSRIIMIMGGCCQICSYSKTQTALELHHIDPSKKELSFGSIRANPRKWDKIFDELLKCILLCANCHREVHDGTTSLPEKYSIPDETLRDYRKVPVNADLCPVCGNAKLKRLKTCSVKCSNKLRGTLDWNEIDLPKLLIDNKYNYCAVARILNISDNSVRKRAKKLKILDMAR